jgi:hypothetical protein
MPSPGEAIRVFPRAWQSTPTGANPRPSQLRYDCAMSHSEYPEFNTPPFAKTALMHALLRHGGSLRASSLLAASGLSVDALCAAVNELVHRRWLRFNRRSRPRRTGPERLRPIDRVTATRFGRWRIPRVASPAKRRRRRPRRAE